MFKYEHKLIACVQYLKDINNAQQANLLTNRTIRNWHRKCNHNAKIESTEMSILFSRNDLSSKQQNK